MFQVNITLTMEQVQWEKSKCLAAKRSLQGRGTALDLPLKPNFVYCMLANVNNIQLVNEYQEVHTKPDQLYDQNYQLGNH